MQFSFYVYEAPPLKENNKVYTWSLFILFTLLLNNKSSCIMKWKTEISDKLLLPYKHTIEFYIVHGSAYQTGFFEQ